MASIHIRFDDDDDLRQVTTRKLPDLPNELTGTAEWKVHRKSRKNSYVLKLQEEDSDGGAPVSYELPVEYINYCWYGLNWNEALKQYFTSNKELLPDNFGGLRRGQPPADEPGPSTIPPPAPPLGEPLQAGTTFTQGIQSVLLGTTTNPASLSSPITPQFLPQTASTPQTQTPFMSAPPPPITAQATITTPADDKTNLRGKQPPTFDGTRSKADNFWRAFKIYRILNKETNTIKNPFHRTALAISFITGPNVDDWAENQLDQLEEKTNPVNPNHYADTDERLWTEFEAAFQTSYQDTTRQQDAFTALMQLEMKGWDVDTYIATFDRLVARAGWSASDKGIMEKFRNGLPRWLALDIMRRYVDIPATLDEWKVAVKKEILRRAQIKAELPSANNGMPYLGKPFQKMGQARNNVTTGSSQPRYVPMDVDVARLGGPLTPEERKRLMDENRCFYCRDKGHRANRCWKKPARPQSNAPKETNPFRARMVTTEQVSSPPPVINQQDAPPREQIAACLKTLSKDEYDELLDEMMTKDF